MARSKLPPISREVWCVAHRDIDVMVGQTRASILMVFDQDGAIAGVTPLADRSRRALRAALAEMMHKPGVGPPRRPQRLVCEGEELRRRVRAALKGSGITIESVSHIPALDPAFDLLTESMGARSALDIVEPARFRALGQRLHALAPWEHLWDNAHIHFIHGGDLDGAHAVFIGKLGLSRAMLLMPDAQTMRHLRAGDRDVAASLRIDAVQLDPPDTMDAEQLREAHQLGLILPGGLVMRMLSMRDGTRSLARPLVQQRLLAALEAVLSLLEANDTRQVGFHSLIHHDHVYEGETIHLHLEIPADPSALVDFDHLFFTGMTRPEEGSIPTAIVKSAKRDAERLVVRLAGAESLLLLGRKLWAIQSGQRIGWIDEVDADLAALWRRHRRIQLIISAGGARRQSLYIKNILLKRDLPLQVI